MTSMCVSITYICSCWFNHVESAYFHNLPSILVRFFNALHIVVSWLLTLKHRLQSITPSTKHLSSWWKVKGEHVRLQKLTSTAFTSTNAGLFFGDMHSPRAMFSAGKGETLSNQTHPKSCVFFFQRKSLKSNRLLSWLFSTTLAKWWKWMGSMASFTWG